MVIIKTIDGNRYELPEMPKYVGCWGRDWFELHKDNSTKHINLSHVVSVTERLDDERTNV